MKKKFQRAIAVLGLSIGCFLIVTFTNAFKNTQLNGFLQGFTGTLAISSLLAVITYGYKIYLAKSTAVSH